MAVKRVTMDVLEVPEQFETGEILKTRAGYECRVIDRRIVNYGRIRIWGMYKVKFLEDGSTGWLALKQLYRDNTPPKIEKINISMNL